MNPIGQCLQLYQIKKEIVLISGTGSHPSRKLKPGSFEIMLFEGMNVAIFLKKENASLIHSIVTINRCKMP